MPPQIIYYQIIIQENIFSGLSGFVNNNYPNCFNKQFKLRNFTTNNKINKYMSPLQEGQSAPWFEGIDQSGKTIKLSDYSGKKIVLYFYPKDDTSGCTAEACNLRDNYETLIKEGFIVIGVSPDDEKSHKGFAGKYSLPYPLIADISKKIINAYGVWGEKNMYGKKVTRVLRTTFIIDESGIIEKVITKVDTDEHARQILKLYNE